MSDGELTQRTKAGQVYAMQNIDMFLAHQITVVNDTFQAIAKISDQDVNNKVLLTDAKWLVKKITDDGSGNVDARFAIDGNGDVDFNQTADDMASLTYILFV